MRTDDRVNPKTCAKGSPRAAPCRDRRPAPSLAHRAQPPSARSSLERRPGRVRPRGVATRAPRPWHEGPRPPGASTLRGCRRARRRGHRDGEIRSGDDRRVHVEGAFRVHRGGPQSREVAHPRGQRHQLRARRRAVVRLRSRPWPPGRGLRGLPQLHEALALVRRHPPGRRGPPRAPGPAGLDAAPRHVLRRNHPARQGLGCLDARRIPRARRVGDGVHRARDEPRCDPRAADRVRRHQHQLPAPARCEHVGRDDRAGVGSASRSS